MFSQYFGHYLLNQGLITNEQLAYAMEIQQSVHVKFGVLAINEGYMTPLQVEEVHEKQKKVDKRFGEIAAQLGYLTVEQIESLILLQKQNYLFLAQALVDRGYMTFEQFAAALNDYKNKYSLSDEQFEAVKSGNIELLVETIIDTNDSVKKAAYTNFLSLFAKNMIRFIDDQTYFEADGGETIQQGKWLVYQNIIGEYPLFTAISANEEVFLSIASVFAEEILTKVDELAKASVSEFLNLHNGIYLVNLSNEGIEQTMNPPVVVENAKATGKSFHINVDTSRGSFQLIISDQPGNISIGQE